MINFFKSNIVKIFMLSIYLSILGLFFQMYYKSFVTLNYILLLSIFSVSTSIWGFAMTDEKLSIKNTLIIMIVSGVIMLFSLSYIV